METQLFGKSIYSGIDIQINNSDDYYGILTSIVLL